MLKVSGKKFSSEKKQKFEKITATQALCTSKRSLDYIRSKKKYDFLEKALWAFASFSRGTVCPGATQGQPQGTTPGVIPR